MIQTAFYFGIFFFYKIFVIFINYSLLFQEFVVSLHHHFNTSPLMEIKTERQGARKNKNKGHGDRHLSHTNSKGISGDTFSVFGYY